jgi:hypothetical protein
MAEMMYSMDLKNISTQEAYFDVFVPQQHDRKVTYPNMYRWDRFTMQKIGSEALAKCPALVPWDQTQWTRYVTGGDSLFPVNIYRILFRGGAYTKPMALMKEINEGLKSTLEKTVGDAR